MKKQSTYFAIALIVVMSLTPVRGLVPQASAQVMTARQLFTLTPAERAVFTPPAEWLPYQWANRYESASQKSLWEALYYDRLPQPLNPTGPASWFSEEGVGSQNHAIIWIGSAVLTQAVNGNVAQFETAAKNALRLLEVDRMQGHQRSEAMGYGGFWAGGVAAMALGAHYAPAGSTSGPELLAAARHWYADHISMLRRTSFPDGQVGAVGARMAGGPGDYDNWQNIGAALTLQILDPKPHSQLYPMIGGLLTPDGRPAKSAVGGTPVRWDRPMNVAATWIYFRAVQTGALLPVPANYPAPKLAHDVYRWTDSDGSIHIATPGVRGFRAARWHVSWRPGQLVRIESGDATIPGPGGRNLPHGWPSPTPLNIPASAQHIMGPGFGPTLPPPSSSPNPNPNPTPTPPTTPTPPPSGGVGGYIRGQNLKIERSAGSTAAPSVVANMAEVLKIAPELTVSIFRKTYKVDASRATIVRNDQSPSNISELAVGNLINIFGSLNENDTTLIHAGAVRNLSISSTCNVPTPTPTPNPTPTPTPSPVPTPTPAPTPQPTPNPTPTPPPPLGEGGSTPGGIPEDIPDGDLYPPDLLP